MTKAEAFAFLLDYSKDQVDSNNGKLRLIEKLSSIPRNAQAQGQRDRHTINIKEDIERWQSCVDLLSEEFDFHQTLLEGRD